MSWPCPLGTRPGIRSLVVGFTLVGLALSCGPWTEDRHVPQESHSYAGSGAVYPSKDSFIVVGDTQGTAWWEFWRERNDLERRLIADEIARREPAFVIHLGDLTASGSSKRQWREFDGLYQRLREKGIPLLPVLGNHDLQGSDEGALAHFFQRFPHLGNRLWYSLTWRNVGLILLDSNFSSLSREEKEGQDRWYEKELERFERNQGIDFVVVCCHHPPFTNSRVVSPSGESRARFAQPFLRFGKTVLFFSGHAHTYERFQTGEKQFIVSGGGGGPRQKVATDRARRRYQDSFEGPDLRFFHFCELQGRAGALWVGVVRIQEDHTFGLAEEFQVPSGFPFPALKVGASPFLPPRWVPDRSGGSETRPARTKGCTASLSCHGCGNGGK